MGQYLWGERAEKRAKGNTVSEEAEQLILDYLRRVGDSAHGTLRADQRVDFVRRLRARIEEMRAGSTDPRRVRKVLARFGDPPRLVSRERERLERESAGSEPPEGEGESREVAEPPVPAAASAGTAAADAEPGTQVISVGAGAPERPTVSRQESTQPAGARAMEHAQEEQQPDSPAPVRSVTGSTPQARPRHSGPPLYEPRPPRQADREVPPAVSRLFTHSPPGVRRMLRSGAIEGLALALTGLGGALQLLPLWFVGALAVVFAVGWGPWDKVIGLAPPVVLAFLGAGALAAVNYGNGTLTYSQALYTYGWILFGAGAVLGAAYLAALLVGRRRRDRGGGSSGASGPRWQRATPGPY